jgi:hypothetical protein
MPRFEATEYLPGVWAPIIIIGLEMNGFKVNVLAIVDSGADQTMIPYEVAKACKVPYLQLPGSPAFGAGGEFEMRTCPATVRWLGRIVCKSVDIAPEGAQMSYALLGRADFFAKHVIRFNWHKNPPEFHIDPIPSTGKKTRKSSQP